MCTYSEGLVALTSMCSYISNNYKRNFAREILGHILENGKNGIQGNSVRQIYLFDNIYYTASVV
jgi:hypothetical protein